MNIVGISTTGSGRIWVKEFFIQQIFTGHLIYDRAFLGTKEYSLGDRMANLLDKMTFEQGSENVPPTDG